MAPESERIAKAFQAMKSLGISIDTVKPALKRLLKLYNKNWELIEEDNYRTLADAIFEYEEDDKLKAENEPDIEDDVPPSKKPNGANSRNILGLNGGEIPRGSSSSKCMDLVPVSSCHEEENSSTPNTSRAMLPLKKRGDGSTQFTIPKLQLRPDSSDVSSNHLYGRKKQIGSTSAHNSQTMAQTTYTIASSACGQVNISLKCNNTALNNIRFPNAEEILTFAHQFFNNAGSNFSLIDVLNEFCERYLAESASDSCKRTRVQALPENNTRRQEIHQGKRVLSSKKTVGRKITDITKGTEKVKISLIDKTGNEELPRFVYSPQNITYESAYVHVSLARISDDDCCMGCKGDCLSRTIPCKCAQETGGEFAYTQEGLLCERFINSCVAIKHSEEKQPLFYCHDCPLERAKNGDRGGNCMGHRYRKFIKECWRKCGCNMECGNRVVQRGITRKLQVFLTDGGKGWGLRTLEELPKGAFICEYVGEILTNMELYERNTRSTEAHKHVYPVLLDADWATEGVLKDEEALCLDATNFGNVARFMNHRCFDGNVIEVPVQMETPDRHYYHLAFFTKNKVDAFEELTWDYEIDFQDSNHPIKAFRCQCGSEHCRDKEGGGEELEQRLLN